MKHTAQIVDVDTMYSQAGNCHVMEVSIEVFQDGESLGVRKFGYPMGTTSEEILAEKDKMCATLDSDAEIGKESAELEAQMENVASIKSTLLQGGNE